MTETKHASKHTPGPWALDYEGPARLAIIDKDNRILALGNLQCEDGDQDEANARLIAAAPELLGALVTLLRWAEIELELNGAHH